METNKPTMTAAELTAREEAADPPVLVKRAAVLELRQTFRK